MDTSKIKSVKGGLIPTPVDERDFSLGGLMGKMELPPLKDFVVTEPLMIKDQEEDGLDDGCTGYSLAAVSEDQEGVLLDPGFTFAMIKKTQGTWQSWGGDLRSGCKMAQKIGFIEVGANPLDFGGKSRDFIANWKNWPLDVLLPKAEFHKKESYFNVLDSGYDTFDDIRAALWNNKDQMQSVYTGCVWRQGWLFTKDGIIKPSEGGVGHAFKVAGQVIIKGVPYLVVVNSYGSDAGKGGLHFFSREIVNKEFTYGAYQFNDMPRIVAEEELKKKGLLVETLEDKQITNPFRSFWSYWKRFIA
ncbi:MAG: cysteine protease [Podoviridae sp. ctviO18]|nr:MAG: cysteine protease [Podoviridae sp. ctviO18]